MSLFIVNKLLNFITKGCKLFNAFTKTVALSDYLWMKIDLLESF